MLLQLKYVSWVEVAQIKLRDDTHYSLRKKMVMHHSPLFTFMMILLTEGMRPQKADYHAKIAIALLEKSI